MTARRVVALGGGDPSGVTALGLEELVRAGVADIRTTGVLAAWLAERGVVHDTSAALIATDDLSAWRLVRDDAALECMPAREELAARATAAALGARQLLRIGVFGIIIPFGSIFISSSGGLSVTTWHEQRRRQQDTRNRLDVTGVERRRRDGRRRPTRAHPQLH